MKSLTVFAIISVITLNSITWGANLINNGDFSNSLTGWSAYNATNLGEAAANPKAFVGTSGGPTGALVIQGANSATGSGVEQIFAIGSNDNYLLSFGYGYTNIGSSSGLQIFTG